MILVELVLESREQTETAGLKGEGWGTQGKKSTTPCHGPLVLEAPLCFQRPACAEEPMDAEGPSVLPFANI